MIHVLNTMGNKKEPLIPEKKNFIRMYVCGPTVYGPAHIGHARTYIAFDVIRRYLEWKGYKVKLVVNITDVHDDMIKEANKRGITIFELAEQYIPQFLADMDKLRVKRADVMPRVTEHIADIIEAIKLLEQKGYAYKTSDGVYYDVSKFAEYGKLSGIKLSKAKTGTRVETDKYDKQHASDFALWKFRKPNEPYWQSPWGAGRPGWHIECSVMSAKHLGLPVDIHGGAIDLIFPHHENEIAQSEAAFDVKPFVKYWLHAGLLTINGQKMSKSLGNFITVPELLSSYDARVFRFFIVTKHYRSAIDFSRKAMLQAEKTLKRLDDFIQRLMEVKNTQGSEKASQAIKSARKKFEEAMDNDFNAPLAWKAIFELESELNKLMGAKQLSQKDAKLALQFLKDINRVFDVLRFDFEVKLSEEELKLIKLREELRKQKRFEEADKIREQFRAKGIELIDAPEGTKVRKL